MLNSFCSFEFYGNLCFHHRILSLVETHLEDLRIFIVVIFFLYIIFSGLVTGCLSLYVSYVYCNEETLFFGYKKNNEAINKKKKIFNK